MSGGQYHQRLGHSLPSVVRSLVFISAVACTSGFQSSFSLNSVEINSRKAFSCPSIRKFKGISSLRASLSSQFESWLQQNGARSGCSISLESKKLVAKEEMKAGAEVCSIPSKLFLTQKTAQDVLGKKAEELDAETSIALQLLMERTKESESFWHPWLSLLPDRSGMNVPLFWSDEEFSLLSGTTVADDTEELKEALADEFEQLSKDGWAKIIPNNAFTLEMYEWAIGIVRSRALTIRKFPGEKIMVPAIDFADHIADESAAAPSLQYEGMFREPRVKLNAHAAVRPGSILKFNYGQRNSALLLKHGLVDLSDAENGAIDISFSVSPMDRFHDDKVDILEINKLQEDQTFVLQSMEAPPEELIAFLRLICIKGTDSFLLESIFRNEVWEFVNMPVSKENEATVLDTLEGYCKASLESITATPQEDRAILANSGASLRMKMAAAVRLGERNVMRNVLGWVEAERRDLDMKEYYQERRLKMLKLDRPIDESEIVDPDIPIRGSVPWSS